MGNYTQFVIIQDDVLAGVAILAAKGPYYVQGAVVAYKILELT